MNRPPQNGDCHNVRANLNSYLDGELPTSSRDDVAGHLSSCPDCVEELDRMRRLKTRLREVVQQTEAPANLQSNVQAALQRSQSTRFLSRRRTWILAAAAVAALVFVIWRTSFWNSNDRRITALLQIGVNDHVGCAMQQNYMEPPPTPARMEQEIGPQFKDLIGVVRDQIPWDFRLERAHRCTVDGRKYVHMIFRKAPELVSVTMTRKEPGESFNMRKDQSAQSMWSDTLYQKKIDQFEAAGGETDEYLWYIVSNLSGRENQEFAKRVSAPLGDYLRSHVDRLALLMW